MDLLISLDALGVVLASVTLFLVGSAWRVRSVRKAFMAICWSLGVLALLLSVLLGRALPVRADSLDFARGICLGLSTGLFIGVTTVFRLDVVARSRKQA